MDNIVYTKDVARAEMESYLPCLVEIWLNSSTKSKLSSGAVQAISQKYKKDFTVIKYRAYDEYDEYAIKNNVKEFPHFMITHRGKTLKTFSGRMTVESLREVLEEVKSEFK